ncbi:hypothetical protein AAOGI_03800 [Agarivorans albus]
MTTNKRQYLKQNILLGSVLLGLGVVPAAIAGQGIELNNDKATLYFDNENWTGGWQYLCLADNCVSGQLNNGRWERDVSNLVSLGSSYNIQLKIQDNALGQYISPSYLVEVTAGGETPPVNQAPQVSIALPDNVIAGENYTIDVQASDADGSVASVAVYVTRPNQVEQLVATLDAAPYSVQLTNPEAGEHRIRVLATDNEGAQSEAQQSLNVQAPVTSNQPPVVNLQTPSDALVGQSITVSAQASDSDGVIALLELFITAPGQPESSLGALTGAPYDWIIDDLVLGSYQLRVVAVDDEGASNQDSSGFSVSDENTAPSENYGVEVINNTTALYWVNNDPSWGGGDYYMCKSGDADCYPAELVDGRWQRQQDNMVTGQSYTPVLKVPGLGASDYPTWSFVWGGGNGGDGGNGGNGGEPDPANVFSHLDWEFNSHNSTERQTPHNDNSIGPAPYHGNAFLRTPANGSTPTEYGFAFELNGDTFSWSWGPGISKQPGDSGLEVYCSENGGETYTGSAFSNGAATVACSAPYIYFFRYVHPSALNNNPASAYIYTGSFTTEGGRLPVVNGRPQYQAFVDGSANWMRFRHPVTQDGTTAAVLDAQHNNDSLRYLDRYTIWVEDSPGNVNMQGDITGNVIRNEAMRRAGSPNSQQFFALTVADLGWGDAFSYGQVIQFEISAIAGNSGAQTYNDFSYYTVGQGWGSYGDVRLNSAGKAGTTMWLSDAGAYIDLEKNATFTQPFTTVHKEQMIDDFIVGHHLFHGVDPRKQRSSEFDDPDVQIGDRTCGNCHFRDGRGSEIIDTAKGPRLPMPTFGVKLLEVIEGRETGFSWDGSADTVAEQVVSAMENDHGVDFTQIEEGTNHPVVELITTYTELLTVPNRDPGAYDDPAVVRGDQLFTEVGCASCHTPVQTTRSDAPSHLRNLTIRPYTDMRLWDLGDGDFRTQPLWGLGQNIKLLERNGRDVLFMHDGSATSIEQAIEKHDLDGSAAKSAFNALSSTDQEAIVKFINTL